MTKNFGALFAVAALGAFGADALSQGTRSDVRGGVSASSPHSCAKGCEFSASFCVGGVDSKFTDSPGRSGTVNPAMRVAGREICKEALAACTNRCTEKNP
jgi:hypothetical protein